MADVTLTTAMRSNLYSLQNTASLMATIQGRLSTGKKVNSALDNPNNYFAAQSLTNRASDLSALLDGMGQAIETLKLASQGITSAQKIVDQMKSVANSAAQGITTASNASGTNVVAYTSLGTKGTGTAMDTTTWSQYSLTSLADSSDNSLNILNGDQMTVQVGTGATYTFTVGASAANNGTKGDGGGTTAAELGDWLETITGSTVTVNGGAIEIGTLAGLTSLNVSGNLATALGLTTTSPGFDLSGGAMTGTVAVNTVAYSNQGPATGSTLLRELTDGTGKVLANTTPAAPSSAGTNTGPGTFLSLAVEGGESKTINITATTTVKDVMEAINSIQGLSASLDPTGTLKVVNNNSTAVSVSGTASGLLTGTDASNVQQNTASIAANGSISTTIYQGYGKVTAANLPGTALTNLQVPNGQDRIAAGDQLDITIDGVKTSITLNDLTTTPAANQTATTVSTVAGLMNALGQINGVTATLDNATGQLDVRSSNGKTITFGGSAASKLSLPPSVAAGQSSLGGAGVPETYIKQFEVLRNQLDELVRDSNYKGINLISSTGNNPLTVTFNEQAINANKLTIAAVDLTTKGLGLSKAEGVWKDTATIEQTLAQLTNAATTLRETSASIGQNLTTVQTRQDFTNNLIATLKSGADDLTLADMNEESANMLALQTRQQLGIQSLSLASQANQAVMRLFG